MPESSQRELVRRFYDEAWNRGEMDIADDLFAEGYVRHDLRPTEALPGPEGQKKIARDFRAAFPDLHFEVDLLLDAGDYVVGRWTATGTHLGAWGNLAPTGRDMMFCGVNIFRFADGKVVEIWNHRDDLGLLQQLGTPVFAGAVESD
jgi:steroid delta-isomerase-like uncharacterized protein